MNIKTFSKAMSELDIKYLDEALFYNRSCEKFRDFKRAAILAAAVIALLALCGFASYEFGLFDPWLQTPSVNPTETVRSAIENQIDKDYTVGVRVDEIEVDDYETARVRARYTGSNLAEERGWTDEYLAEHFVAVRAKYYVEYDHTKTFTNDGYTEQYFYLIQDTETCEWTITDNTSPNTTTEPPLPNAECE